MNSSEMQMTPVEWLLVGCRGAPVELVIALNVCRLFEGTVIFREKDVLIVEFGVDPAVIDEVLAKLPRLALTHVWRSGRQSIAALARAECPATRVIQPNFCST